MATRALSSRMTDWPRTVPTVRAQERGPRMHFRRSFDPRIAVVLLLFTASSATALEGFLQVISQTVRPGV